MTNWRCLPQRLPMWTSGLSQTVHVPAGYPLDQFEWIYFKAWSFGLKGLAKVREIGRCQTLTELRPFGRSNRQIKRDPCP